jgi:hypothetical protein
LRDRDAISPQLLSLGDPSCLELLTLSLAIFDLADAIVSDLLAFDHSALRLKPVCAHLLPLCGTSLPFHLLPALGGTGLNSLDALRRLATLGTLDPLRTRGALEGGEALRALHARCGEGLALRTRGEAATAATPLDGLRPLGTAAALLHDRRAVLAPTAVGPRARRGSNRERSNAGCEKHPGHHKISFRTARTARSPHRSFASTDGTCGLAH